MEFNALPINERTHQNIAKVEKVINGVVRGYDSFMGVVGLGGRKGRYDDHNFEFKGYGYPGGRLFGIWRVFGKKGALYDEPCRFPPCNTAIDIN